MKTITWNDPIVDEIHAVREAIAREAGNDLHQIVVRLQASEQRHGDKLVTLPQPRKSE